MRFLSFVFHFPQQRKNSCAVSCFILYVFMIDFSKTLSTQLWHSSFQYNGIL